MRRERSIRIRGQSLLVEGHNGEDDRLGRVTWLPVQEIMKGWVNNEEIDRLKNERIDDRHLDVYRGRQDMPRPFNSGGQRGRNGRCYKCGEMGHIAVNCRGVKCFACGEMGHISTYCPGRAERIRCTGCGRFGHVLKDCRVGKVETRAGFPQRGESSGVVNMRSMTEIVGKEGKDIGEEMTCFKCRERGHWARDCNKD
ncbi:DNA-binding protein HEXBP-like [Gordionus sp. m RMFG-2023]|uniref:DNA-binding protein HEXBP-like n=1 Tax=Gordionus sp. m RMFG-2023 TaxID=3053472 RepID=UPI0031FC1400